MTSNAEAHGMTNGAAIAVPKATTDGNKELNNHIPYRSSLQPPVEVALSPNDAASVPSSVDKIQSLGRAFSPSDNASRLELLAEARRLVRALEMPRETMIKHNWAQPAAHAAITLGTDIGLFHAMLEDEASPKSAPELAKKLHVDANMLARTMRHMAAMGYIEETGEDQYRSTNFSKSLVIPIIGDGYSCL